MNDLLYMEIDLKQLESNLKEISRLAQKQVIPVVKSRAYGMGDIQVLRVINKTGIDMIAVVDMTEALNLVRDSARTEILILNSIRQVDLPYLNLFSNFIFTVNSLKDLEILENFNLRRKLKLHLQVDTGMNRMGFKDYREFETAIKRILARDDFILDGIYTHFTDTENQQKQIASFRPYLKAHHFPLVHCAASSSYLSTSIGNAVRIGVDLYGGNNPPLKQILKIACFPLAINRVKKGDTIGYDRHYKAEDDELIAILPIGYSNGYRRSLSGFPVLAAGKRYPTVGKICMNHLFVRVDESISIDSEFIITSEQLTIQEMATYLNTVPHEILCMFNIRNIRYLMQ
ncbi:MAG: alanine racemase [Acholeplasmataceae bacterium]|nr:alanine racemase [Acholeplasmataceae bacterium]